MFGKNKHFNRFIFGILTGVMHINCHEKFKKCMKKVESSGKKGFSMKCPYEVAIPLMTQGMDMAIMLGQLGSQTSMV